MKIIYLRDKDGNKIYPPPKFTEINGQMVEISQIPLYIYAPDDLETRSDQPTERPQ